MPIIQWTPDLTVGIETIDRQHQKLFGIVDELLSSMRAGKGRAEIKTVLDFLGVYVFEHFALEERTMLEIGDPNYRHHKAEHEEFVRSYQQLQSTFSQGGANTAFVLEVNNLVCGWLRNHITKTDPKIREAVERFGRPVVALSA